MKVADTESARFQPTVFGAVRRYRIMVLAFAVAAMVASVGYTLIGGKTYRAEANITVPMPQSLQGQNPAQYLDSQVLLLQSQAVAQQAAAIANAALHSNRLSASDFSPSGGSLSITPPAGASAGVYGASITGVMFTSSSPQAAQVGANALLQAFIKVRNATIAAQARAAIAGIDNILNATDNPSQRATLLTERTQALVNEQADLAQQSTVVWAAEPTSPASGGWKQAALIGFVIGLVLGAGVAYIRASRRRGFADRQDPAALYGVPLIGEIPAFTAEKTSRSNGKPAGALLPMTANPHSGVAEAFRFAAGSIERIRAERGPRLSLVFVSPLTGGGKSTVVANLALAIAEGGTRVLVVDADGDLTAGLLPGNPDADGLEQILAGRRVLGDCVQPNPSNSALAVLGPGPASPRPVTGAARSKAASFLLAEAKERYDIVLIDSPALLEVANATELVNASDAAIIVLSPNELIRDHLEVVERLNLIGSDVVGYIYNRAPMPPSLARYQRNGSSPHPMGTLITPLVTLPGARPSGGEESGPSSQPPHE